MATALGKIYTAGVVGTVALVGGSIYTAQLAKSNAQLMKELAETIKRRDTALRDFKFQTAQRVLREKEVEELKKEIARTTWNYPLDLGISSTLGGLAGAAIHAAMFW